MLLGSSYDIYTIPLNHKKNTCIQKSKLYIWPKDAMILEIYPYPGDADPGDLDPVDPYPGDADPGDPDPSDADPGYADPGDPDPDDSGYPFPRKKSNLRA
jgi:hypothetical protein